MDFAVIVVSDRTFKGEREDKAVKALMELISSEGWKCVFYTVVPDEVKEIKEAVLKAREKARIVITCGGTGFGKKDFTPEALEEILERKSYVLPAYIVFKTAQYKETAALSRSVCGTTGGAFVIAFPGSEKAVKEWWEVFKKMAPHLEELLSKDVVTCGG